MMEPTIISLTVCLFKVNLDQTIGIVKNRKINPAIKFIGIIKKDKKMLNETCNELLIK